MRGDSRQLFKKFSLPNLRVAGKFYGGIPYKKPQTPIKGYTMACIAEVTVRQDKPKLSWVSKWTPEKNKGRIWNSCLSSFWTIPIGQNSHAPEKIKKTNPAMKPAHLKRKTHLGSLLELHGLEAPAGRQVKTVSLHASIH